MVHQKKKKKEKKSFKNSFLFKKKKLEEGDLKDYKLKKSMATLSILGVICPLKPPSHECTPALSNSVVPLSMALHLASFFHL